MKSISMRILIFSTFLCVGLLQAENINPIYPPLFASVTGVAEDDTLNIREKPNSQSSKTGELPPKAFIGIEKCLSTQNSTWCKVYQITQQFYEGYNKPGWVNAKYLKPSNKGYVLIDGLGSCDYALGCDKDMCDVVTDYESDENYNITALERIQIKRDRLRGESSFGATNEKEDGFCTTGH
jgi:hypothetical protein